MQKKQVEEIRCEGCRSLLAVVQEGEVVIKRGGMQVRFDGSSRVVSIVCYRCKRMNAFQVSL